MRKTLHAKRYATPLTGAVLAVVFAACCFGLNTLEQWVPRWEIKPGQDAPVTLRLPSRYFRITMLRNEYHYLATSSSTCANLVAAGTKLVPGRECTGMALAYQSQLRHRSPLALGGLATFYLLVGLVLTTFMRHKSMGRARQLRGQITVIVLLLGILAGAKAVFLFTSFPAGIVPVVIAPLLVAYFCRRQVAVLVSVVIAITTCSLTNFDIELFLIYVLPGIVGVVGIKSRTRSSTLIRAGATAAWVALLTTAITTAIFAGTLAIHDDWAEHFDPRYSLWIAALFSGLGSGLVSWIVAPLVGALFGEISRSRLLDLQDLDQRLLKLLRERAPGTWEHSRAMANLAEAAAHQIGANALLVRVGAYYHDVGKGLGPEFYIENQGGRPNPHDELSPYESANRIFKHVVEGTRILRQEGIPEDVVEFSYSHHGTSVLEYFWHKNLGLGNGDNLSEKDFSYPGHKPTTRETGILMLVDAIEAAARTVDHPDKTTFQSLVQRIIFTKLCQGQLDESSLTLGDLAMVANTLVDTLVNVYHVRIKYPWQKTDSGNISAITTADVTQTGTSLVATPPHGTPLPEHQTARLPGLAAPQMSASDSPVLEVVSHQTLPGAGPKTEGQGGAVVIAAPIASINPQHAAPGPNPGALSQPADETTLPPPARHLPPR